MGAIMDTYELTIPKTLYSKSVLMRTGYRYIDRVYIHFSAKGENWIVEFNEKNSDCNIELIAKEFENTLISQALREIINERTKTLREIILARSLTSTYIDEEDPLLKIRSEQEDVSEDELDKILKNWFEIYEN